MPAAPPAPLTFFDKVWRDHLVRELGDGLALVYVDRVLLHELSGAIALDGLKAAGRTVRNPALTFATVDHVADTRPDRTEATPVPDDLEAGAVTMEGVSRCTLRLTLRRSRQRASKGEPPPAVDAPFRHPSFEGRCAAASG